MRPKLDEISKSPKIGEKLKPADHVKSVYGVHSSLHSNIPTPSIVIEYNTKKLSNEAQEVADKLGLDVLR